MLISVQLFVQGDNLQPGEITRLIGFEPALSYALGDTWASSGGKSYKRKVGLWKWGVSEESEDLELDSIVDKFCRSLQIACAAIERLPNAERTWIDVFICHQPILDESSEINFCLSNSALRGLSAFGLPVEFTASLLVDDPSENPNK
jgi:Domain of unknown function (DUF4279)